MKRLKVHEEYFLDKDESFEPKEWCIRINATISVLKK